ncbi:SDR family oxidoreductase [Actinospica durhamensis]|uniref:SDR family oxidoreductase n=1 Tax=Actinospica durhamensis TaxID=1508375 RepID=A0A941EQP7_9ACTN|nr:SDR family oxidoreductase [Actinospica durhamensis]MBR7836720.1 SDR family oxidoreductase [Actinospica durhamensis]
MIVITAASGQLGRLTLEDLLSRGVPAGEIRAVVRERAKLADFAERGVEVLEGDYTDRESLVKALAGAEKYLLISSAGSDEDRIGHHLNAIAAAREAGVGHLVYTSIPEAETNPIGFAWVHRDTEKAIRESGLPFTFLRNNWYFENATGSLGAAVEHGALIGAAGEGRVGYAARADYAAAAAAVLAGEGHEGQVYELTGDVAISQADLAAEVSRQSGKEVGFVNLPEGEYAKALEGFGLPSFLAAALAEADVRISEGALAATTDTLATLIGRPTTTLADAVAQGLRA